tara:strand:- start:1395 stop:2363 length:969 start_codon:yes stop_codon:yes gene_type:complete
MKTTDLTMADLVWDEEFSQVNRPHTPSEAEELQKSIEFGKVQKITDPILVIKENGNYPVIDGYHRMQYWTNRGHSVGIPEPRVELMGMTRREAVWWMRVRQGGRRNNDAEELSYQRGKALREEVALERQMESPRSVGEIAQQIAEEAGVSERTVLRDRQKSEAIDKIGEVDAEMANRIRGGETSVSFDDAVQMSHGSPQQINDQCENLRDGRRWNDYGPEPSGEDAPEEVQHEKELRLIRNDIATVQKRIIVDLRTYLIKLSQKIHPNGQPRKFGFPMKEFDQAITTIDGRLEAWKPAGVCPDCEWQGCPRCQKRGWLKGLQ